MSNSKGRPGVMFYYDCVAPLRSLSHEQMGRLFFAAIDYAHHGEVPEFEDAYLQFAWGFLRTFVDRDAEKYASIVEKRSAAAKKRCAPAPEAMAANAAIAANTKTKTKTKTKPRTKTKAKAETNIKANTASSLPLHDRYSKAGELIL